MSDFRARLDGLKQRFGIDRVQAFADRIDTPINEATSPLFGRLPRSLQVAIPCVVVGGSIGFGLAVWLSDDSTRLAASLTGAAWGTVAGLALALVLLSVAAIWNAPLPVRIWLWIGAAILIWLQQEQATGALLFVLFGLIFLLNEIIFSQKGGSLTRINFQLKLDEIISDFFPDCDEITLAQLRPKLETVRTFSILSDNWHGKSLVFDQTGHPGHDIYEWANLGSHRTLAIREAKGLLICNCTDRSPDFRGDPELDILYADVRFEVRFPYGAMLAFLGKSEGSGMALQLPRKLEAYAMQLGFRVAGDWFATEVTERFGAKWDPTTAPGADVRLESRHALVSMSFRSWGPRQETPLWVAEHGWRWWHSYLDDPPRYYVGELEKVLPAIRKLKASTPAWRG